MALGIKDQLSNLSVEFYGIKKSSMTESTKLLKLKYAPSENRRMIRNVIVLSIAFTLLFTAYSSIHSLQSSINQADGLGNWSSAVIYISMVISAIFVPTACIRQTSVKWAIFFSMFGYTTFIAAQFYPRFETLIPAAAIVGMSASPLWAAKCTYLTRISTEYATLVSENVDGVIVRFFGLFFMTFHTNSVFGNLISSTILSSTLGVNASLSGDPQNNFDIIDYSHCGAKYCPQFLPKNLNPGGGDMTKIYVLATIYVVISLTAATVIALCLDSLRRYGETTREDSAGQLLVSTFNQLKNPYQVLMIPITVWVGLAGSFLTADFSAAFVSCGWGVEKLGFVLICFGLTDSIACIFYPLVVQRFGRIFVCVFGATVSTGTIITFLNWAPNPGDRIYFFVLAGLWGMADSCWGCGINAYYGVLFGDNSEAAFSNFRLWDGLGAATAYAISNLACVETKLYFLLTTLMLGMAGFFAIQICEKIKLKNKCDNL